MLSQRLHQQEFEIRDKLRGIRRNSVRLLPKRLRGKIGVSFSVRGLRDRRVNSIKLMQEVTGSGTAFGQKLHSNPNSLNGYRRSAACPYEQFRARVWAVTTLPTLFDDNQPAHFLTITHPRHRCYAAGLAGFDIVKIKRMVQALRLGIVGRGIPTSLVGMIELTVVKEQGISVFEPHVHLIVSGPTEKQLRKAVAGFPKRSTTIRVVKTVPGLSLYLTKFAATERSAYIGKDGKQGRRPNGMKSADKSAWLSFMARHGVSDLLLEGGFQPNLKQGFLRADMADLVDSLVRPVSPNGPKTLPSRQLRPKTA